ncbi:hypothetical protein MY8738_005905 [Beauveria namnaoensis]
MPEIIVFESSQPQLRSLPLDYQLTALACRSSSSLGRAYAIERDARLVTGTGRRMALDDPALDGSTLTADPVLPRSALQASGTVASSVWTPDEFQVARPKLWEYSVPRGKRAGRVKGPRADALQSARPEVMMDICIRPIPE